MTFGEKIKILRNRKGLTQTELAETLQKKYDCNIIRADIANYEKDRNYPSIPNSIILSRYFKTSLDDLFYNEKTTIFKQLKRENAM